MAWSRIRVALLLATLALALAGCGDSRGTRVVLITIDTLRYDTFAGGEGLDSAMPRTRAWSEDGLRFTRFFAPASVTQPSHATYLTGLHPWEHGVTRNGLSLSGALRTAAEMLRARGFATVAVVASLPVSARFGTAQGFDVYREEFDREPDVTSWEGAAVDARAFYRLAGSVTAAALAELAAARSERQFFWLHYYDPHEPYGDAAGGEVLRLTAVLERILAGRPSDALLRRGRELYREDVALLDAQLERVFARLEQDRDRFATHVLFTADHGESFGEHGAKGHGERTTAEQIHVPLVVHSPAVEPGERDDVAGGVDLLPTLLSLAGVPAPDLAGRDLTRPPRGPGGALGMRRSLDRDGIELRADGTSQALPRLEFFRVAGDGSVCRGHGGALVDADGRTLAAPESDAACLRLFARLERGMQPPGEVPEDVEAALRALGYQD